MAESVLRTRSFEFAVKIVNMCRHLCEDKKEFILSKQLLRSSTSVGAMVCEAAHAESKADFIHKLGLSQKEINESIYWIELMLATGYISQCEFEDVNHLAIQIMKMITSSIKTAKTVVSG